MLLHSLSLHQHLMQGVTENKKAKLPGGHHHHPLNMVWKIRRGSRDSTSASPAAKAYTEKGVYLKSSDGSHSSRGSSEKQYDAEKQIDVSSGRDQSTRSGGSSRSANSRNSEGSSDHHSATSGSTGSSVLLSKASDRKTSKGTVASAQSKSQVEKCVRFNEIQIRDYERIVGDNPSCSSGPPIALGWAHGDTRVFNVDAYEESRPCRKRQVRIVLTREEREQILLNWGVSFHDIIDSIRTNIKVKNQRRQTVTNLGKVERIEEAFENATRKLKGLLLRRKTGDKVKQLQEQSEVASHTLASLKIAEERALSEIRADVAPIRHEPEHDNLENLEVQVSVSDFCRKSPAESKIHRSTSNLSEEDGASVISGFTLGNSTTASMLEVERFYRELELEMFGETELPSMVGQTLEVPGVEIPEEERYYEDLPSVAEYIDDSSFAPPKVFPYGSIDPSLNRMAQIRVSAIDRSTNLPHEEHRSMLSRSLQQYHDFHSLPKYQPQPSGPASPSSLHQHYPSSSSWYGHNDPMVMNQFPNVKLSTSLDSCEMSSHYARGAVAAVEQQYLPMFAPPSSVIPASAVSHSSRPFPYPYPMPPPNGTPPAAHTRHNQYFSSSKKGADGPRVRHVPPPTHLSPSHWMDDCDGPSIRRFEEPITIMEEGYESSAILYDGARQQNFAPSFESRIQTFPYSPISQQQYYRHLQDYSSDTSVPNR